MASSSASNASLGAPSQRCLRRSRRCQASSIFSAVFGPESAASISWTADLLTTSRSALSSTFRRCSLAARGRWGRSRLKTPTRLGKRLGRLFSRPCRLSYRSIFFSDQRADSIAQACSVDVRPVRRNFYNKLGGSFLVRGLTQSQLGNEPTENLQHHNSSKLADFSRIFYFVLEQQRRGIGLGCTVASPWGQPGVRKPRVGFLPPARGFFSSLERTPR
jgi:hypothetical protein